MTDLEALRERVREASGPGRDDVSRFMSLSFPEPMSGCWLWDGNAYEDHHGRFKPYFYFGGKNWLAHRASVWLLVGRFPLEKFICHKCDNSLCVNPDHLYVGDHASNMRDMADRNRSYFARNPEIAKIAGHRMGISNTHTRGEGNPKAKLNSIQVEKIRTSEVATKTLAKIYGVDRTTIQRIRRGSLWQTSHGEPPR